MVLGTSGRLGLLLAWKQSAQGSGRVHSSSGNACKDGNMQRLQCTLCSRHTASRVRVLCGHCRLHAQQPWLASSMRGCWRAQWWPAGGGGLASCAAARYDDWPGSSERTGSAGRRQATWQHGLGWGAPAAGRTSWQGRWAWGWWLLWSGDGAVHTGAQGWPPLNVHPSGPCGVMQEPAPTAGSVPHVRTEEALAHAEVVWLMMT